jgi:dipeptidyl aminopeptidase/acylaminoacyl peptidase
MQKLVIILVLIAFSIPAFSKPLPVETFFKDVAYRQVKISPDGKLLAFTYDDGLSVNLAILDIDNHKILSSFDFGDYKNIYNFFFKRNDRIVFEVQKVVGNLDNSAKPPSLIAAGIDGKNVRQLFDIVTSWYSIASRLPNDPDHILINRYHWHDEGHTKLFKIDIDTGINDYVGGQPSESQEVITDIDGNPRFSLFYEEEENDKLNEGKTTFLFKKTPDAKWAEMKLKLGGVAKTKFNALGLSKDNQTVYVGADLKNAGDSIFAIDLNSLSAKLIHEDNKNEVTFSARGADGSLEAVGYSPDYNELIFLNNDSEYKKIMSALYATFPGEEISITSFTEDQNKLVFKVSSHKNPGDYYLFDREKPTITYLMSSRPQVKPELMSTMTPFKMNARDGVELNGYLTVPKDKNKNLPTIVMVHGGPHGPRDSYGFNPEAQFFANRGYAVVQVNFRGSGGYGDEFMKSGYRQWGRKMQDDVTDATHWAIKQGIANKDRLCIYGGSYGGYAALMGVIREPDLYQCSVGYVGVYSLPLMYKVGDTQKSDRGLKFWEAYLGKDEDELKANSPVFNVDKIKAALFIVHGEKDVRVPIDHYNELTEALDKIGKPYESMLRDEGHGFSLEKNRYDLYNQMIAFFDKHTKK